MKNASLAWIDFKMFFYPSLYVHTAFATATSNKRLQLEKPFFCKTSKAKKNFGTYRNLKYSPAFYKCNTFFFECDILIWKVTIHYSCHLNAECKVHFKWKYSGKINSKTSTSCLLNDIYKYSIVIHLKTKKNHITFWMSCKSDMIFQPSLSWPAPWEPFMLSPQDGDLVSV